MTIHHQKGARRGSQCPADGLEADWAYNGEVDAVACTPRRGEPQPSAEAGIKLIRVSETCVRAQPGDELPELLGCYVTLDASTRGPRARLDGIRHGNH